jgi:hypothetical protein
MIAVRAATIVAVESQRLLQPRCKVAEGSHRDRSRRAIRSPNGLLGGTGTGRDTAPGPAVTQL